MDRFRAPAPAAGDDWIALAGEDLPVAEVAAWVLRPHCGAVVTFTGTARDHSPGREGVHRLDYEAYEEHAVLRMEAVLNELRVRWPAVGRVALLHRTGVLAVSDAAVVVAVSAPHRVEAFAAARFGIDEVKRSVPIWKREAWADGESWGLDPQACTEVRP
ncbi:MAG: molybdenum cofactor biosynthesis protein MoaE [Acidimicrobiia bacterium]|nr:molybdenum cofactor biosynthesis protein MoaE [Acidimicrobiia bacterium]